jgi:hypothetical protein
MTPIEIVLAFMDRIKWQIAAAWRAVVENGLVKEWRVFADNKPVYDIMAKSAAPI